MRWLAPLLLIVAVVSATALAGPWDKDGTRKKFTGGAPLAAGPDPDAGPSDSGVVAYDNAGCARFNGTDARLDWLGGIDGVHDGTTGASQQLLCYFEIEENQSTDSNEVIIGANDAAATFFYIRDIFDQSSITYPFGNQGIEPNLLRLNDAWIHTCYRFDSTGGTNADRLRIFMIDDDASATLPADCSTLANCEQTVGLVGNIPSVALPNIPNFRVGGNAAGTQFWGTGSDDSRIDELVIWRDLDVPTITEMQDYMNGSATVPPGSPTNYFPLNANANDLGSAGQNGTNVGANVVFETTGCPPGA